MLITGMSGLMCCIKQCHNLEHLCRNLRLVLTLLSSSPNLEVELGALIRDHLQVAGFSSAADHLALKYPNNKYQVVQGETI